MSKISKTLLIVGGLCVLLSFAIGAFNFGKIFNPFIDGSGEYTRQIKTIDNMDIELLKLITSNENVEIVPTRGEQIVIIYYDSDYHKYNVSEKNNSIYMEKERIKGRGWRFFQINMFAPSVKIEVPEQIILAYDIKTSNSSIAMSNLTLNTSSFTTSNGKIDFKNIVSSSNISLKSSNGRINLDKIEADKLSIVTSNGAMNIERIEARIVDVKTSNGSIDIDRAKAMELILRTSNGRITLDNIDARKIDCKTSNSRINATIIGSASDYQRDIRTSNGKINIGAIEYGTRVLDQDKKTNILMLHTSNGRIDVNFVNRSS